MVFTSARFLKACNEPGCHFKTTRIRELCRHGKMHHSMSGQNKIKRQQSEFQQFILSRYPSAVLSQTIEYEPVCYMAGDPDSKETDQIYVDAIIDAPQVSHVVYLIVDAHQNKLSPHVTGRRDAFYIDAQKMMDASSGLFCGGDTRPILWVRYNPDEFYINGCRHNTKKRERYAKLDAFLQTVLNHSTAHYQDAFYNQWGVTMAYFFYNCDTDKTSYDLPKLCGFHDHRLSQDYKSSCFHNII